MVRVAESPPGWLAADVARPALGGGSGATLTQWSALGSPDGDVLLLGCVATPIPGWVEDMRPSVQGRTTSFAASSAEKIVGAPIASTDEGGHLALRLAGTSDNPSPSDGPPRLGVARTFVGWQGDAVVTCFAACARSHTSKRAGARACDASVEGARLEGGTDPPPPGLTLGAVTWAIHHPSTAVLWGGVLTFFFGLIAVVARRRPRSRI